MSAYRNDNQINDIRTYEKLFSSWIPKEMLGDFFLRLDLLCVCACIQKVSAEVYLQEHWNEFFPQYHPDAMLLEQCMDYYSDWNLGLKLRSKGTSVRSKNIQEKAIMIVTVIASITRENILDAAQVTHAAMEKARKSTGFYGGMEQNLRNVTERYYHGKVPAAETAELLEAEQSGIQALFTELLDDYSGTQSQGAGNAASLKEPRRSEGTLAERILPERSFNTTQHFMSAMLMMYHVICHQTPESTPEEREALMQNQWALLFCSIPYTERSKREFYKYVDSVPNLRNLKLLWGIPMRKIKSEAIIRSVVIPLCANYVLSKLPHRTTAEVVIDEALMRFEIFKTLSIGMEVEDTVEYVNRFKLKNGCIDEHIMQLVSEHEKLIAKMFRLVTEEIDERIRYMKDLERTVNKQDEVLKQLQSEKERDVKSIRSDTYYDLIKQLSSPVYNYLLSRLYRAAYGFDAISQTETRLLLLDLFQVLQVNGVTAVGSDLIGLPADAEHLNGLSVIRDNVQKVPEGYIVFPGWNVSGNVVYPPIVSITLTEEAE